MDASERKAGNDLVLDLFRDALKSDVANGLLPLLTDEHHARLRFVLQEAMEKANTESVPARNGVSKPNRPPTKKRKIDGDHYATDLEPCQTMLSPTPTPHIHLNLLEDPHATDVLSQRRLGRMEPPQNPDLASYHYTLPSADSSVQGPVPTQLSDSYRTSEYSQMSEMSEMPEMPEMPAMSAPPETFGGLRPEEPPVEDPAWGPELEDEFIDWYKSNKDGLSDYD